MALAVFWGVLYLRTSQTLKFFWHDTYWWRRCVLNLAWDKRKIIVS